MLSCYQAICASVLCLKDKLNASIQNSDQFGIHNSRNIHLDDKIEIEILSSLDHLITVRNRRGFLRRELDTQQRDLDKAPSPLSRSRTKLRSLLTNPEYCQNDRRKICLVRTLRRYSS